MLNFVFLFLYLTELVASSAVLRTPSSRPQGLPRAPLMLMQRNTTKSLEKRFSEARLTFFDTGLGSCGKTTQNSDFIVALNSAQYDGGAHCFEIITITVGSKQTTAQIVDECPGCPFAGLDLSRGLFDFFAPESVGVLTGSWVFGAGAPPSPPTDTTTVAAAATTSKQSSSHSKTSTPVVPPATSTTLVVLPATSTTPVVPPATSTTPVIPPVTSTPSASNIGQLFQVFIEMGTVTLAGLRANGSGSA